MDAYESNKLLTCIRYTSIYYEISDHLIKHRCNKLKKEMEAAQKKEAEDTAAMEKMLGEVEANLLTTTVSKQIKEYYKRKTEQTCYK